jgi:hypothetical protein
VVSSVVGGDKNSLVEAYQVDEWPVPAHDTSPNSAGPGWYLHIGCGIICAPPQRWHSYRSLCRKPSAQASHAPPSAT